MPALVSCHDVGGISRLGPGFLRPRALVDKANKIDQLAAVHWVIDKVPARPEPELTFVMQFARWHPVRWHEPAIGDAAGELRIFRPQENLPHHRADTVGPDHDIGAGAGTICKL